MAEAVFDSAVAPEVPDQNGSVEADLTVDQAPAAEPEVEPPVVARGLYLVRVPKPPVDDSELKKTQAEFQECVAKLKSMQSVLTSKRDARRALQRQMDEARGLKETTQPEYQEKADQMSKLRDRRDDCISQIKSIRGIMLGVDVKSEAELDKKLDEMDQSIRSGTLPIRDERNTIQQMSRLRSQRPKIKEFAEQEAYLSQLEDEVKTIKGLLSDMGGEFDVIRSERNATNEVVKGILDQLKKVRAEITELEAEQAELSAAKNAALEQLDAIRGEADSNMRDYRDNRKFSLTVRDMVAASQMEEAGALVSAQVDDLVMRLSTDKEFRAEYFSLSAQTRRAPVSELLPESCTNPEYLAAQKPAAGGKGGKGGKGAAGPAQPRGKELAADIISKLMAAASKEAASKQAGIARDSDEEEEEKTTPAPAPLRKAAAEPVTTTSATTSTAPAPKAKLVKDAAAAAAAAFGNFKVELPVVPEPEEFVPPVIKSDADEKMTKEQLREEQMRKAAEAEERKKRRAEQGERKKQQAIEAAKKQEQERKDREAAVRTAAAAAKAAEAAKKQQQEDAEAAAAASGPEAVTAGEETTGAVSDTTANVVRGGATKSSISTRKGAKILAERRGPVVKKPKSSAPKPIRTALAYWEQYQGPIILAIVMLFCVILAYLFLA